MKRRLPARLLLFLFVLTSCGKPPSGPAQTASTPTALISPRTLTVFAASSLTNAFNDIGKAFEAAHPGVTVTFNFAGSQTLREQVIQGARADVIALASLQEMHALGGIQLVDAAESKRIFASNKMVVILPPGNPAKIAGLQDLARPGLKLILAGEPVPAGKYARVILQNLNKDYGAGFNQKVLANVVSNEENVRQVVSKIELGEGDAGIVYVSDASATPDILTLEIPADANDPAQYPIAALHDSANRDLAEAFIGYVLAPDGQSLLKKWGFLPPQ